MLATGALAAGAPPPAADTGAVRRSRALIDLIRYVEWPAAAFDAPDAPFVIGILGRDALADALEAAVVDRRAQGRTIVVRRYRNLDEYEPSQLLYVSRSKARRIDVIRDFLRFLDRPGVLTVAEREGFTRRGGLVRLVVRDDGIGFEIDAPAAAAAGLVLGAELLELAGVPPPAAAGAVRR